MTAPKGKKILVEDLLPGDRIYFKGQWDYEAATVKSTNRVHRYIQVHVIDRIGQGLSDTATLTYALTDRVTLIEE